MGIINVNDDSFSNDGTLSIDESIRSAIGQVNAGADIIDVGAESARTNRKAIDIEEEIERFVSFMQRWDEVVENSKPLDAEQVWPPVLSLNTWRSEVVEKILPHGGELLNDMSALPSSANAEWAAHYKVALLIMHSVGEPKIPHTHQQWEDVMGSMHTFFTEKIEQAIAAGVARDSILIDPGIDFAKQRDDNLTIYKNIAELKKHGCCILLPVSRKTVIGDVLGVENPQERDAGTVACVVQGVMEGVHCFRVHNVTAAFDAVKMVHEIESEVIETD